MSLVKKHQLINELSPPLDALLVEQLVEEFISIENRYVLEDWESTELDGGQFAEISARIIYQADSGNINRSKGVSDCLRYITNEQVHHSMDREDARSLERVIHLTWKFRSKRGAVHITPNYSANQMDARLVLEGVRWTFLEILRIFWSGDREVCARAIREIIEFDVPCIGRFGEILLVQRTDLAVDEEILVLLHYAGECGFSRREIGSHVLFDAPRITRSIQKLLSSDLRQIVQLGNGNYRLTALGTRRIMNELAEKLRVE